MPTTFRLLFLLMLGLFGLQPVSYGYDAPTAFVSGAQNIVAASPESQAATAETAASVPLNFNRNGAASDTLANIGKISNFVAAESGAASVYDTSITAAGSRVTNVATNVSTGEFQANLVSNGFKVVKQTTGSNGPATILSDGQTTYTIYTGTSTGAASAQVTNAAGQTVSKIRLGTP